MALLYLRYRRVILPFSLWLFSLILVSVQSYQRGRAVRSPFSRGVSAAVTFPERAYASSRSGMVGSWKNYLYLVGIQKENLLLQKQIAFLEIENQRLQEQALENERLRSLLEFKQSLPYRSLPARIIGWDLSAYARTVTINVGFRDGVQKGQAVIGAKGLIGQIIDEPGRLSGPSWAQVLLITDPTSRVSVVVERTRDRGILEGIGKEDNLLLKYLAPEARPIKGEVVVTSGLGGIFPQGIPVGKIERIEQNPFSSSPQGRVRPSADFAHLEELLVIIGEARQ